VIYALFDGNEVLPLVQFTSYPCLNEIAPRAKRASDNSVALFVRLSAPFSETNPLDDELSGTQTWSLYHAITVATAPFLHNVTSHVRALPRTLQVAFNSYHCHLIGSALPPPSPPVPIRILIVYYISRTFFERLAYML
jgi:hypothetical protein